MLPQPGGDAADQRQPRILIVNADDLGASTGVNDGIVRAHGHGVVTSASLMVRGPAAAGAVQLARDLPALSVGLHVDLGEWEFDGADWQPVYEVVDTDDPAAVAVEVEAQLRRFRDLTGRDPTHLDSHQHVHRDEPARRVLTDLARRLGVPLRHCDRRVRYLGAFYGQTDEGAELAEAIGVEALIRIIRGLEPGVTELCCHPGYAAALLARYGPERERELRTLCDPEVRRALESERVLLRSFRDLSAPGSMDVTNAPDHSERGVLSGARRGRMEPR